MYLFMSQDEYDRLKKTMDDVKTVFSELIYPKNDKLLQYLKEFILIFETFLIQKDKRILKGCDLLFIEEKMNMLNKWDSPKNTGIEGYDKNNNEVRSISGNTDKNNNNYNKMDAYDAILNSLETDKIAFCSLGETNRVYNLDIINNGRNISARDEDRHVQFSDKNMTSSNKMHPHVEKIENKMLDMSPRTSKIPAQRNIKVPQRAIPSEKDKVYIFDELIDELSKDFSSTVKKITYFILSEYKKIKFDVLSREEMGRRREESGEVQKNGMDKDQCGRRTETETRVKGDNDSSHGIPDKSRNKLSNHELGALNCMRGIDVQAGGSFNESGVGISDINKRRGSVNTSENISGIYSGGDFDVKDSTPKISKDNISLNISDNLNNYNHGRVHEYPGHSIEVTRTSDNTFNRSENTVISSPRHSETFTLTDKSNVDTSDKIDNNVTCLKNHDTDQHIAHKKSADKDKIRDTNSSFDHLKEASESDKNKLHINKDGTSDFQEKNTNENEFIKKKSYVFSDIYESRGRPSLKPGRKRWLTYGCNKIKLNASNSGNLDFIRQKGYKISDYDGSKSDFYVKNSVKSSIQDGSDEDVYVSHAHKNRSNKDDISVPQEASESSSCSAFRNNDNDIEEFLMLESQCTRSSDSKSGTGSTESSDKTVPIEIYQDNQVNNDTNLNMKAHNNNEDNVNSINNKGTINIEKSIKFEKKYISDQKVDSRNDLRERKLDRRVSFDQGFIRKVINGKVNSDLSKSVSSIESYIPSEEGGVNNSYERNMEKNRDDMLESSMDNENNASKLYAKGGTNNQHGVKSQFDSSNSKDSRNNKLVNCKDFDTSRYMNDDTSTDPESSGENSNESPFVSHLEMNHVDENMIKDVNITGREITHQPHTSDDKFRDEAVSSEKNPKSETTVTPELIKESTRKNVYTNVLSQKIKENVDSKNLHNRNEDVASLNSLGKPFDYDDVKGIRNECISQDCKEKAIKGILKKRIDGFVSPVMMESREHIVNEVDALKNSCPQDNLKPSILDNKNGEYEIESSTGYHNKGNDGFGKNTHRKSREHSSFEFVDRQKTEEISTVGNQEGSGLQLFFNDNNSFGELVMDVSPNKKSDNNSGLLKDEASDEVLYLDNVFKDNLPNVKHITKEILENILHNIPHITERKISCRKLFCSKNKEYFRMQQNEFGIQYDKVVTIELPDIFYSLNVIDTSLMFCGCNNLEKVDISSLNTSNVTSMESMFRGCSSLKRLDLSSFDTTNVKNFSSMFYECANLMSLDLSSFNTSTATDMCSMFRYCSKLNNLVLTSFDTRNVTEMVLMFDCCYKLTEIDITSFDTSKVIDSSGMFCQCPKLELIIFNMINMKPIKSIVKEFPRNSYFKINREDKVVCKYLSKLGKTFYYKDLFDGHNNSISVCYKRQNCTKLSDEDFSILSDLGKYYDSISFKSMFSNCSQLVTLDFPKIALASKVHDMSYMFFNCSSLTHLDVSKLDTSKVKNMSYMFDECSSLTALDLKSFKTSEVTDMSYMFDECSSLNSLDLTSFNTSKVTDMSFMFKNCKSLRSLNLTHFDTSKVEDMNNMFNHCCNLSSLDLSSFDTRRVTNMNCMFYSCQKLNLVKVSNFTASEKTNTDSMFGDNSRGLTFVCTKSNTGANLIFIKSLPRNCNFFFNRSDRLINQLVEKIKRKYYVKDSYDGVSNYINISYKDQKTQTIYDTDLEQVSILTKHYDYVSLKNLFSDCLNLVNVYFPANFNIAKMIDTNTIFNGCINLKYVICLTDDTSLISSLIFSICVTSDVVSEIPLDANFVFNSSASSTSSNIQLITKDKYTDNVKYLISLSSNWYTNDGYRDGVPYINLRYRHKDVEFLDANSLSELKDLPLFYSSVSLQDMFSHCSELRSVSFPSFFKRFNVTDMSYMFNGCSKLESVDLSMIDTSNVVSMSNMFSRCKALKSLDLSTFITSNVQSMNRMFYKCFKLSYLSFPKVSKSSTVDMKYMFEACSPDLRMEMEMLKSFKDEAFHEEEEEEAHEYIFQ